MSLLIKKSHIQRATYIDFDTLNDWDLLVLEGSEYFAAIETCEVLRQEDRLL